MAISSGCATRRWSSASCARRGIEPMLLKGAALTLLHYRDSGLRPMEDVDILVRTHQWRAAVDCAHRSGMEAEGFGDAAPRGGESCHGVRRRPRSAHRPSLASVTGHLLAGRRRRVLGARLGDRVARRPGLGARCDRPATPHVRARCEVGARASAALDRGCRHDPRRPFGRDRLGAARPSGRSPAADPAVARCPDPSREHTRPARAPTRSRGAAERHRLSGGALGIPSPHAPGEPGPGPAAESTGYATVVSDGPSKDWARSALSAICKSPSIATGSERWPGARSSGIAGGAGRSTTRDLASESSTVPDSHSLSCTEAGRFHRALGHAFRKQQPAGLTQ